MYLSPLMLVDERGGIGWLVVHLSWMYYVFVRAFWVEGFDNDI